MTNYQKRLGIALGLFLSTWLLIISLKLFLHQQQSVDAFLVLGGSIRREIYAAKLAKDYPQAKIIISQGSLDPCIRLIFKRENANQDQVWLEHCAHNTFTNFYYGLDILRNWKVHKVKLITSQTHLPRAQWMAQIILGSHGIWVETDIAPEKGIPGNQESSLKTSLDVTRSFFWAIISQFVRPSCPDLKRLTEVNMDAWQKKGFKCEHQAKLD
ncbi:MAG: YdcF family protein [Spirulinaceae cyanobacterium]